MDQRSNRHKQLFPTVALDLADDEAVRYLGSLLTQKGLVFYLHCAPPCGTASRARERRLSRMLKRLVKEPQPLRSSAFPQGLPNLKGLDLHRVTVANAIYCNVAFLCEVAILNGCYISIEHPSRSYMRQTKWMQNLINKYNLTEIKFQQCMWGGKRDKWSSFLTNDSWLQCNHWRKHVTELTLTFLGGSVSPKASTNSILQKKRNTRRYCVRQLLLWHMMLLSIMAVNHNFQPPRNAKPQACPPR